MKILVFSDLHHQSLYMEQILKRHLQDADWVFFLGDGLVGFDTLRTRYADRFGFMSVSGNCDGFYLSPDKPPAVDTITLAGKKFLLTHGHTFYVKDTLTPLTESAYRQEADVVLFGHTHIPLEQYLPPDEAHPRPLYLFNPGSIGHPAPGYGPTFGLMEIRGEQILLSIGQV